jgi:hypothetical protein
MLSFKYYLLFISWISGLQVTLDIAYFMHLSELQNTAFLLNRRYIPDYTFAMVEILCLNVITIGIIIFLTIKMVKQNI